ncbi:hypothetical protein TSUD_174920 [Trifolium subterraneum]|uniref:SNF2 N-terminal domain-containing protein n=1 Tax=Trifolium subterraneum TaxID=3900 RepID=A0A2Z6NVW3_TRISU|nr:hypothetical protein TSUD_174920 [Trifolium subterraneum]
MVGVSSRTRSKKVPLFSSFSLDCSSSKRKKSDEDVMSLESVSGSKRRRVKDESFVFPKNDEVIFIDQDDYYEDGSEHCDVDVKKEGKIDEKCGWGRENPITIEESDEDFVGSDESDEDDDSEENDTSDEDFNVGEVNEISDNDDESSSDSSFVDDEEEEVEEEEEEEVEVEEKKKKGSRKYFNVVEQLAREVNDEISGEEEEKKKKGSRESFNVVEELIREVNDEKSGEEVEKEKKVNEIFDSDGNSNDVDNDEEEVREEEKENEISESDGSSNDVIVDDEEEEKEKGLREPNNAVEEVSREVNDEKIGEEEEKEKKKVDEIFGNDDGSSNQIIVDDVEEKVRDEEKKRMKEDKEEDLDPLWQECNNCLMEEEEHLSEEDKKSGISKKSNQKKKIKTGSSVYNKEVEHSDYGSATASTTFNPMKGSSSKRNETSENVRDEEKKGLRKPNNVVEEDEEEIREDLDPLWQEYDNGLMEEGSSSKRNEASSETHKAKSIEGFESKGQKRFESKGQDKKESKDNNGLNQRGINAYFTSKDLSLVKLLAECYSDKKSSMNNDPILLEVNSDHDDVNPLETRKPPVFVETPLIWSLKKVQEVELTEEEEEERRKNEELNPIWDEMVMCINESEAESKIGNLGTNEATQENNGSASSRCEHVTIYDEEIGVYCKSCGEVITESKYMTQLVRDKYPYEGYEKRASLEDSGNASRFDYSQSQFNASDGDLDANFCQEKGTVWDLIPEVKETLYPHQQEGFKVIWKNLAGSINRKKLKNADPEKEGGCIISHAPGTGKTRLTIVFLMAYLKVFPKCFPVIVAPAGLLHTWEDEFRKWNIGVPFHNLNNPELSGKEHQDAVNELNWSSAQHTTVDTRMAKLISWYKETSILGISYTLYKELAGTVESENENTKNQANPRAIWLTDFIALFSLCGRYGRVMLRSEAFLASSASELFATSARDPYALHLWLEKGDGLFDKCCSELLDIKYWHFEELECFCYVISCAFVVVNVVSHKPLSGGCLALSRLYLIRLCPDAYKYSH